MNKRYERWREAQKKEELFWDTWNVTEEEEKKMEDEIYSKYRF